MLYDCKRISYWIDRRLTGLAGPDYAATISFGLPFEPEDSQYGKSRLYISRETHVRRPAQEQRANLQGTPGNDSGIWERDCGRWIIVLKQT